MEFEKLEDGWFQIELSRRNLVALLEKLDDPDSRRTLIKVGKTGECVLVKAVKDEVHYSDRTPGLIYMPSTGEYR